MLRHRQQDGPDVRVTLFQWGPTVVLHLVGRLIAGTRAPRLPDLTELMTGGGRCLLVLDVGGVSRIDCTGIGQLVALFLRVRRLGGCFALVNVERRQKRLLDMSGLLAFFPALECPRTAPRTGRTYDVA